MGTHFVRERNRFLEGNVARFAFWMQVPIFTLKLALKGREGREIPLRAARATAAVGEADATTSAAMPNTNPEAGERVQSPQDDRRDGVDGMDGTLPASPSGEAAPVPPGVSVHAGGEVRPSPALPGFASFLPDDGARLLHPTRLRPWGEGPPCSPGC